MISCYKKTWQYILLSISVWNPNFLFSTHNIGESNRRHFPVNDLWALLWFDMERESVAYQRILPWMGAVRLSDGKYQLYKILMAARHSNSQLEAIPKKKYCHGCCWSNYFQRQISVVYCVNWSHHFLPNEIQRLSPGPSSKNKFTLFIKKQSLLMKFSAYSV